MDKLISQIKRRINEFEDIYLKKNLARKNSQGIRRIPEEDDIRPRFLRDADRILHSNAYRRYIDKTQVFYLIKNDHITHRVMHVQWVSKIARFIGRVLGLNSDLIEAIALGHDIGHCPFGHTGETILDEISKKFYNIHFKHNVQSVRELDKLEKHKHNETDANGLNLTLEVLDGILCHNGEINEISISPNRSKTFEIFDKEITEILKSNNFRIRPFTLEGCLVRFVDTISYIGRDIEDAIILGFIKRDEIPNEIKNILGDNNRDIINNLVLDLIENSKDMDFISYSKDIGNALIKLKNFNYKKIYENPKIKTAVEKNKLKNMFYTIFEYFLNELNKNNKNSEIFKDHINYIGPKYLKNTDYELIVIDFISGMTDSYFIDLYKKITLPEIKRLP
ncbi:MAG: deoxyguanosinetriphosphate triphosphohydrolase family protein [Candidatus Helarchaeota archaeon]